MEGSFADAANNHGFKRSRWRRLWRQRIQDYLIAVVQNVRILIRETARRRGAVSQVMEEVFSFASSFFRRRPSRLPLPESLP